MYKYLNDTRLGGHWNCGVVALKQNDQNAVEVSSGDGIEVFYNILFGLADKC